jgi:Tfp pilus assembly protein PilN
MPQHINLLHAGLLPRREAWRSAQAAAAIGGVAVLTLLATLGLRHAAGDRAEQALAAEQELAALQARINAASGALRQPRHAAELQRLHAVEAGQRQVRAALDRGAAGRTQGYAEVLLALSRQARPSVWLTAFSVPADGAALELQGRMSDPHRLPDYLRQLNSEPLFKGRSFTQMTLKAVEPAAAGAAATNTNTTAGSSTVTEFTLRAVPAARAGGEAKP